jgi:hypothetical protein
MRFRIHPHAALRLRERGAKTSEATRTVRTGTGSPAKFGRTEFVARFPFGKMWLGKKYATKQVHAIAAPQGPDDWLIVTVIVTFY